MTVLYITKSPADWRGFAVASYSQIQSGVFGQFALSFVAGAGVAAAVPCVLGTHTHPPSGVGTHTQFSLPFGQSFEQSVPADVLANT